MQLFQAKSNQSSIDKVLFEEPSAILVIREKETLVTMYGSKKEINCQPILSYLRKLKRNEHKTFLQL